MEGKQSTNELKMNNKQDKPAKIAKPKNAVKDKKGIISSWMDFLKEVRVEMKKVTWPPRKEIIGSTTALLSATVLIGVFLGAVDLVLAKGIQPALAGHAGVMSAITLVIFIGILFWVYKSN
jgi:preprotein translocase subunit SecE